MNFGKLAPGLAMVLFTAGLAAAFIATQEIRFAPDPSTTIPRGVSAAVPRQAVLGSRAGPRALRWSEPVRVVIPAIGVDAPVTHVGQNPDGTVQTPPLSARNLAGWYDRSVTPGQAGSSVLVGHVDSQAGPSVFFGLKHLRPRDLVKIRRADGTTAVFAVDGVQAASKAAFPTRAVYAATSFPSLRLVTCGGPFDYATGHYADNIIVYAHLAARALTPPGAARTRPAARCSDACCGRSCARCCGSAAKGR
jgi:sortase (surface protein transpeptidase)